MDEFTVLDQCYCMPNAPNDDYPDHKGVCQYCRIKALLGDTLRENERLRVALEYYAQRSTYWVPEDQVANLKDIKWKTTNADEGFRARQALNRYKDREERGTGAAHPNEYDEYIPTHEEIRNKQSETVIYHEAKEGAKCPSVFSSKHPNHSADAENMGRRVMDEDGSPSREYEDIGMSSHRFGVDGGTTGHIHHPEISIEECHSTKTSDT